MPNPTSPSSEKRVYQITEADLPLCCPMPNMRVWDGHPRVYLPVTPLHAIVTCPYCDAEYHLLKTQHQSTQ